MGDHRPHLCWVPAASHQTGQKWVSAVLGSQLQVPAPTVPAAQASFPSLSAPVAASPGVGAMSWGG